MSIKWKWSFSSPLGDGDGIVNAEGTLRTSNRPRQYPERPGTRYYKVKSIKGFYNGDRITGLVDSERPLPDSVPPGDNLLTNKKGWSQLTPSGINFELDNGLISNIHHSIALSNEEGVDFASYLNYRTEFAPPSLDPRDPFSETNELYLSESYLISFKAFIV
jgi:hypothetical protein